MIKFKSQKLRETRPQLALEFRRANSIAWIALVILFIISFKILADKNSEINNFSLVILVVALSVSLLIDAFTSSSYSYFPIVVAMLATPVLFQNYDGAPWFSYGFIAVAAALSVTSFDSMGLAIISVPIIAWLQVFVGKQNLSFISDNTDISYANGFYSIVWIIFTAGGALITKNRYFKIYDQIDSNVDEIFEQQFMKSQQIDSLSTSDHKNLRMHGTLLNTLIAVRNRLGSEFSLNLAQEYIQKDIDTLKNEDFLVKKSADFIVKRLQETRFQKLEIQIEENDIDNVSADDLDKITEIIREILLNIDKHTKANKAKVQITMEKNRNLRLIIEDNLKLISEISNLDIDNAQSSISLARLISSFQSKFSVTESKDGLKYTLDLDLNSINLINTQNLRLIRIQSQLFLARAYISISIFYLVACLPLFIFESVPFSIILIGFLLFLLTIISLRNQRIELIISYLSGCIALTALPIAVLSNQTCSNLNYVPWLFNGLLGPIFISTITSQKKFIKWLFPLTFFIECLILQNSLPKECSQLLGGSIPGIIFISILALVVLNIRRTNEKSDEAIFEMVKQKSQQIEIGSSYARNERDALILDISKTFAGDKKNDLDSFKQEVSDYILKIRNFLIAVEHFDKQPVRELFEGIKNPIFSDKNIQLMISGNRDSDWLSEIKSTSILEELRQLNKSSVVVALDDNFEGYFRIS